MPDRIVTFKRRLAKLIEISNEMALNADDGQFSRREAPQNAPTNIFYVFDESVFELFINPDDVRRKYPAFFHLELWREDGASDERYWILVNQMLSILTAEYLWTGKLPGQGEGEVLHMTYGHRLELGRRYASLVGDIPGKNAGIARRRLIARRLAKQRLEEVASDDDHSDHRLSQDLSDVPDNVVNSITRARRLARIFAKTRKQLAADQLRRFSSDVWPRVKDLDEAIPMTSADGREIEAEARRWRQRFADFMDKHPVEGPRRDFKRDAHALAQVQHIAREHLDADERIVFVTGDSIMLQVYWLWYGNHFIRNPNEPNIMRSVGRFSPVVNVDDMMGSGREGATPFEQLQVALNLAIQPWKLTAHKFLRSSSGAPSEIDTQKIANLWYFHRQILDSVNDDRIFDPKYFEIALTDNHLDEADREFRNIRDSFQRFERNSCRAGLDLLEKRRELVLALDEPSVSGNAEDDQYAIEYFRSLASDLVEENARLWLPIAKSFLSSAHGEDRPEPYFRAPLSLRLASSGGKSGAGETRSFIDIEEDFWTSDNLAQFEEAPHIVFVLGSLFALRRGQWADAEMYADLAKVAYRSIAVGGSESAHEEPDYQELRYLRAVSARMSLGALKQNSVGSTEAMLRYFAIAQLNLKSCIDFHRRRRQSLREGRALSERASVQFFLVARRLFGSASSPQTPETAGPAFEFVLATADHAIDDLLGAYALLGKNDDVDLNSDRGRTYLSVENQVFANVMAIDCLLARMPQLAALRVSVESRIAPLFDEAERWLLKQQPLPFPYVVRQEVIDFLRRRGKTSPTGWHAVSPVRLEVDRELLAMLARAAL